jgi:hypothetical protein
MTDENLGASSRCDSFLFVDGNHLQVSTSDRDAFIPDERWHASPADTASLTGRFHSVEFDRRARR